MYAEGKGVERDDAEAVKWFRKAAEQDYASAQNQLGMMYEQGRGVPRDYVKATEWYRKAAERGYGGAQNNQAIAYALGQGVPTCEGPGTYLNEERFCFHSRRQTRLPDVVSIMLS